MKIAKFITDILLIIITLLLTSMEQTGRLIHEILGITMAVLLVVHIFLNWNWIIKISSNLKKVNKKTKVMYIVNIFTMLVYFCSIIFGIMISSELFRFKTSNNIYLIITHLILGRLSLVTMFIHIGINLDKTFFKIKSQKLKNVLYFVYLIVSILALVYSIYKLTNSYPWMYMFKAKIL